MNKQRIFILGDEWCYFKIYTGFKSADLILLESLFPLAISLKANQIIDKWFFIRFADPKFNLRIRFHVKDRNKIPFIIFNFNQSIKNYVDSGLVWKVQADTYNREIERYGDSTIELTETIFYYDSEMICEILKLTQVKQDENLRWLLGLKMIDVLLDDFDFTLFQKLEITNILQDSFGKEFGLNKEFRRQFGQNYRKNKLQIEKILNKDIENEIDYAVLFSPIFEKSKLLKNLPPEIIAKTSEDPPPFLQDLLISYIHMMMNRLFRTQQRTHELILYDYLFRYYDAKMKRSIDEEKRKRKDEK